MVGGSMKKLKQQIKDSYKESKRSSVVVYFTLRLLVILTLIRQAFLHNYDNVLLCVLTLILLILPFFIQRAFKITLPNLLEIIILCFIFSAEILGEINSFYIHIPEWDTILHTLNGFLVAGIGFSLVDLLNKNIKAVNLSPLFVSIVAFSFSMTIGVMWEFFEYSADRIVKFDMQKDEVISSIYTVSLDSTKSNQVIPIENIDHTIIYDHEGNVIATIPNGYLDIGLRDTMNDLLVNFIGAVIFCCFGYLYLQNEDKFDFAKNFIVTHEQHPKIK